MDALPNGRVAFLGCGKMGQAMLSGWLASKDAEIASLMREGCYVVVPTESHGRQLADEYGVQVFSVASQIPADATVIVLAVKPQVLPDVLGKLVSSPAFAQGSPLVISIAAGVSLRRLEAELPAGTSVIRAMPNMPLQAGEGATVLAGGTWATDDQVQFAQALFAALGMAEVVEEDQIDAVCALSGGGPAYFAFLAECLAQAGVQAGLSARLASLLARQTLAGTGRCLISSDMSPEDLRVAVSSPGGTTLAALAAMEREGFPQAVSAGVEAAIQRAKELSAC